MNTAVNPPDTTPPVVNTTVPAAGAINVGRTLNITATFNEAMTASTIDSNTFQIRDAFQQLVSGVVTYDPATFTASFDPVGNLAHNQVYTATVRGGAADPRVKDASGNALGGNATWSFTVAPQGTTCPCTLFEPTDAPLAVDFGDTPAVEVGVRFRASRSGYISAIRYYKSALNTGQHIGTVWNSSGQALGQALFVNEGVTGWQQANFSPAIPVVADTLYTASYFAPSGHYSSDLAFFDATKDSPPLQAPAGVQRCVPLRQPGRLPGAECRQRQLLGRRRVRRHGAGGHHRADRHLAVPGSQRHRRAGREHHHRHVQRRHERLDHRRLDLRAASGHDAGPVDDHLRRPEQDGTAAADRRR